MLTFVADSGAITFIDSEVGGGAGGDAVSTGDPGCSLFTTTGTETEVTLLLCIFGEDAAGTAAPGDAAGGGIGGEGTATAGGDGQGGRFIVILISGHAGGHAITGAI